MALLRFTHGSTAIEDLSTQELVAYHEELFGVLEPFAKRRMILTAWSLGWDQATQPRAA
jgi:hypothetical protein